MAKTKEFFGLSAENWKKLGKGALIAAGGALITYLAELIPSVDFEEWTPVAVGVASVLVNFGRKWLAGK